MNIRVSIITICFNARNTIQKTFDSVRNQTYNNIEYIVVDGGSTDGTIELIKNNSDIISKWVSEKDNGISDAFNKGIIMSTGDYVLLLNADDELVTDIVKYVAEHIGPDADIIHGNMIQRRIDGRLTVSKPSIDYDIILHQRICVFHPGMFIKKSAYEKYGLYDTGYKCAMDRELVARMYSQGAKLQYIDKEIVIFTEGGASTKYLLKYTIPEDIKISTYYGANYLPVLCFNLKHCIVIVLYFTYHRIRKLLRLEY